MRQVVGIDRKIKRFWLDAALDRLALKKDDNELRSFMEKHLQDELPGKESRAKAIGIILRIWSTIPPERLSLRDRALELLPRISGHDRIWLHWGMSALAYPFFRDTAEVVGRLLALQDDFTTAQVQDRIVTAWGDRVTSKLAARYLLNTFVDWELLRATKSQGHFLLSKKTKSNVPELQLWLLEALLNSSAADEIEAQQLMRLPESFPFSLSIGIADLRQSGPFVIHRQGLDMDMVGLAKKAPIARFEAKPKPKPPASPKKPKAPVDETPTKIDKPKLVPKRDTAKLERRAIEGSLKKDDAKKLVSRIDRFQEFYATYERLDGHYATSIRQCLEMYRDGYFSGCILLSADLIEVLVQQFGKAKMRKTSVATFEKNLEALRKIGLVDDQLGIRLHSAWTGILERSVVTQLQDTSETDLKSKAREIVTVLLALEQVGSRDRLFS